MIRDIRIRNFKSVKKLDLALGRVNVLIGENGCGKTNVLEAIAFAAAAASDKLDNEFLATRGIRTTEPALMRSAFPGEASEDICLAIKAEAGAEAVFTIRAEATDDGTSHWVTRSDLEALPSDFPVPEKLEDASLEFTRANTSTIGKVLRWFRDSRESALPDIGEDDDFRAAIANALLTLSRSIARTKLAGAFLIFSPENTALRTFQTEGQILPLGIRGEGLFRQLTVLANAADPSAWNDLRENLRLLDWFDDIEVAPERAPFDKNLRIRDRYLGEDHAWFDQRSSNEGFLFLLFYFTLLVSRDTPTFFAVDNIDQSLNPKTCTELVKRIVELSAKYGKQVIMTTHNPAVLDGLNLHDDEQRLFVLSRNRRGETRARRVPPPAPLGGEPPIRLSEAFLRGLLGGLPQNF